MERKCSQTLKIPFPTRVFYGTEVTIDVPKSGDLIKNVRVVLEFPNTPNSAGERIIEKIDLIVGQKSIESLQGEYMHVENNFNVPAEKYDKLNELLCVSIPGTAYLEIPFKSTSEQGLYLTDDTTQIRILFANQSESNELTGHILVDYYLIQTPQKFPYVQTVNQVQRFTNISKNPKNLRMLVYAVGPVYQLYFTVKDLSSNTYVDGISNIKLNFGEKERFNLSGQYLRYVEPLKRLNTFSAEPMYMYNFCLSSNVPSGSTHFNEKSYFDIDFYDNQSTYEVTIWAKSHDFVYVTEKTVKPIFESTEMLIDTTQKDVSNYTNIPLRVSYINYSGSIVIFYSSPYEISNVNVETNALNYTVTQNTIEITKIDSISTEYTANVIFSATGFSDTKCYFRILGNNMYIDNVYYSSEGNYPTHIDLGQNFHYILGNVFDFSNTIFTSNIQSFTIDENKNYAFSTFTTGNSSILGSSTFTGPGSIIAKYDQNMNLLFTITNQNSNVTELSTANTYGVYNGNTGTVVYRDYGNSVNTSAGSASVFIDVASPIYTSLRFSSSSSPVIFGNLTSSFGIGTPRCCLASQSSIITVSNINQVKTALDFFSNGNPVWTFMYTSSSSGNGITLPSSTNGYLIWSQSWSKSITNITNSNNLDLKLMVDKMTGSIYFIGGYSSTTPSLSGYTFATGSGFFVVKLNSSGAVQYVLSFIGNIQSYSPILDTVTGRFMITVKSNDVSSLKMYNNGVLKYDETGIYQFFIFDDYGNLNSSLKNLNELFSIAKPLYFNPLCTENYFDSNTFQVNNNTFWTSYINGSSNDLSVKGMAVSTTDDSIYSLFTVSNGFSNVYDKYGDTKSQIIPNPGTGTNVIIRKFYSNCVVDTNWNIRVTNILGTGVDALYTNQTHLYFVCTTNNSGTCTVLDKNGTTVLTLSSLTSNNLLFLKFNLDGTYANWYMTIPNCYGISMYLTSTNRYVCGNKIATGSQSISINGSSVGSSLASTSNFASFVIKLNSSDSFLWSAYLDNGCINGSDYTLLHVDSSNNVYMCGTKKQGINSLVNGVNVIPSTIANSAYVVKFNSSGSYASWYTQLAHTSISTQSTGSTYITKNSSNELFWTLNMGDFGSFNSVFSLYVNSTTPVTTISKIAEASVATIKFNSSDVYQWNVRFGTPAGNLAFNSGSTSIDNAGNIIVPVQRQGIPLVVFDRYGSSGGSLPACTGDAGSAIKINYDGTFSNNYGYIDTIGFDAMTITKLDKNNNIYIFSSAAGFNPPVKDVYIYDKNGFITSADVSETYRTPYLILLKYNSNMTLNKISL